MRTAKTLLLIALMSHAAAAAPQALPPLDGGTVLLVVAPHPDDETLCCAGVIQRVLAAGGQVSIVWITSGDGSELGALVIERTLFGNPSKMLEYGQRRMHEARAATGLLGVAPAGQVFLGYPDGGVLQVLGDTAGPPYVSRFTGAANVPYPQALSPGHSYEAAAMTQDFEAVLTRVHPTLILAPSPLDSHPDHRAAGLLTLATTHAGAVLRFWIVHGGEGWPSPRGLLPGVPLSVAPLAAPLGPAPFLLTPAEEDRKLAALRTYETQMRVTAPFLLSFVRSTELFSVLGVPDPARR